MRWIRRFCFKKQIKTSSRLCVQKQLFMLNSNCSCIRHYYCNFNQFFVAFFLLDILIYSFFIFVVLYIQLEIVYEHSKIIFNAIIKFVSFIIIFCFILLLNPHSIIILLFLCLHFSPRLSLFFFEFVLVHMIFTNKNQSQLIKFQINSINKRFSFCFSLWRYLCSNLILKNGLANEDIQINIKHKYKQFGRFSKFFVFMKYKFQHDNANL